MRPSDPRAPERTCVGCRRRRPQTALVRCVLTEDGRAAVDRSGPGRGAWLCVPSRDCFALALRRKAFARAWRRPVGPGALAELGRELGVEDRIVVGVGRDDEKG